MTARPCTLHASFATRFWNYLSERFPLHQHGLLIVSYYSSNQFLAHALSHPDEPMRYSIHSLMGALCILCMFFHLRVFDEHKDYEEDLRHYPNRVLQSGRISLTHLKWAGGIAIALELLLSATRGPPALLSFAIAFAFSILMLKEFFIGKWLKQHFLVYALSHMLIMPLMAMVVFSFATMRFLWEAPPLYWLYAFVGFFVTLNWEISRKIRAPDDEVEGIDTYTRVFGTYGAAYAVLLVRVIDTAMVSIVGYYLELPYWFYFILAALFCVCLVGFLQFRRCTNRKTAKRMETYAGIYIIAFDATLAIAIIIKHGVTFGTQ